MRFIHVLITAFVFFSPYLEPTPTFGQSLVSASSGRLAANNIELYYSVGELTVTELKKDSLLITQGFLQQYLQLVNTKFLNDPSLEVFPNPTTEILQIKDTRQRELIIQIWHTSGILLYTGKVNSKLDFTEYPPGAYQVLIYSENQTSLGKFTVLKI